MSFLRRLKERRGKGSQNGTPTPATPEAEQVWGDDGRKGPLADFVAAKERNEGSVDLGQANGSWSQGRQRSRLPGHYAGDIRLHRPSVKNSLVFPGS